MSGLSKHLGVALVLLSVANGAAQVEDGVRSGQQPTAPAAPETRGAGVPGHIGFDDATASRTFKRSTVRGSMPSEGLDRAHAATARVAASTRASRGAPLSAHAGKAIDFARGPSTL